MWAVLCYSICTHSDRIICDYLFKRLPQYKYNTQEPQPANHSHWEIQHYRITMWFRKNLLKCYKSLRRVALLRKYGKLIIMAPPPTTLQPASLHRWLSVNNMYIHGTKLAYDERGLPELKKEVFTRSYHEMLFTVWHILCRRYVYKVCTVGR